MIAFFTSGTTLRRIFKEYNVPFRDEYRQCGNNRATKCFSIDDVVLALKKYYSFML